MQYQGGERDRRVPLQDFDVVREAWKVATTVDNLPSNPSPVVKKAQNLRRDLGRVYKRLNEKLAFQDGLVIGGLAALELAAIAINILEHRRNQRKLPSS